MHEAYKQYSLLDALFFFVCFRCPGTHFYTSNNILLHVGPLRRPMVQYQNIQGNLPKTLSQHPGLATSLDLGNGQSDFHLGGLCGFCSFQGTPTALLTISTPGRGHLRNHLKSCKQTSNCVRRYHAVRALDHRNYTQGSDMKAAVLRVHPFAQTRLSSLPLRNTK